jgi:hypothetical protein
MHGGLMDKSMEEYIVNLHMFDAQQMKELLELCQLIVSRFPGASVKMYEKQLCISFLIEEVAENDNEWSQIESDFFDGLKLLGLITGWNAVKS